MGLPEMCKETRLTEAPWEREPVAASAPAAQNEAIQDEEMTDDDEGWC